MNPRIPLAALAALLLAACAHVKTARIVLPEPLAGDRTRFEELALEGVGGKPRGDFRLGEAGGRFERSLSRAEWFNATVSFDRGGVRYTLDQAGGAVNADCRVRRSEVQLRGVTTEVKPLAMDCSYSDGARLKLDADVLAAGGTRVARVGRYEGGGVVLALRSVHAIQGAQWWLPGPAGYLLLKDEAPLGAVELTGVTPRLWRPRAASPEQQAVTRAALALALLWDPDR